MLKSHRTTVLLKEYNEQVAPTDKLGADDLKTVLLGLAGEVGTLMSAVKKHRRDTTAYIGYTKAVIEELGDTLWYLAALCRRLDITLDDVFKIALGGENSDFVVAAIDLINSPVSMVLASPEVSSENDGLTNLVVSAADLFKVEIGHENNISLISHFVSNYIQIVKINKVSFASVIDENIKKARGTFLKPDFDNAPTFDSEFEDDERLPEQFEIHIRQRKDGKSYMSMNGVFIGDPLSDNIADPDGYRFHDVFHFALAAILHWSPTFRALLKRKRKSNRIVDEAQDGGRAIVVEEGLSAWVFSIAKDLNFFEGHDRVSVDVLKTIQQFVKGYEVDQCSLSLWNKAIIDGYKVFRELTAHKGGIIRGNRRTRSITFTPFGEPQ